jgi:hypothetical protein
MRTCGSRGVEFIGFASFAIALLAAGVAVHIAELDLPRKDKRASIAGQNGSLTHTGDREAARTGSTQANGDPVIDMAVIGGDDPAPTPGATS